MRIVKLLQPPGLVPYQVAWDWQRRVQQEKILEPTQADVLFLFQHPPVYTLGLGATLDHVKFAPGQFDLHRTERGGEVTYHGPGQLVGYPILDLKHYRPDLHWYLRQLEEVVIQALALTDVAATRIPGLTGVWVEGHKVAAIGIKVSRWVTLHGFALNVHSDLDAFRHIIPCGLTKPVANWTDFCPQLSYQQAETLVKQAFQEVFGVVLVPEPSNNDHQTGDGSRHG